MAGKEQRIMGKLVKEVKEESPVEMGVLGGDFDGFKKKKVAVDGGGKRGSAGGGGGMRCCQAENCVADLSDAKPYYRRHKVCEHHSKAQIVIVNGIRQRFCQQCSRFHEIAEFDDTKRSCRRRLAGHNERRRKNFDAAEGSGHKGKKLEEMVFGQIDENVTCKHFQIK